MARNGKPAAPKQRAKSMSMPKSMGNGVSHGGMKPNCVNQKKAQ